MGWLISVSLALVFSMAPLSARAADLVVWWEDGYYAEEDAAVREIVAAFEQETGKQVELIFYPQAELPGKIVAALEAGQPPDFAFGLLFPYYIGQWAFDDRLVDLSDAVGHFSDVFDPEALGWELRLNGSTGQKALYGLPMGRTTTTSTSGRACWNTRGSPSPTFRRSGRRSGRSGATTCSRPCAGPPGEATSGASDCPCRAERRILRTRSSSS